VASLQHFFYPLNEQRKMYFPNTEIPWAAKYFMDALGIIIEANFTKTSGQYPSVIDLTDNRYKSVSNSIRKLPKGSKVLDAGSGKGRFLKKLAEEFPGIIFDALDISREIMKDIPDDFKKIVSPMTNINSPDSQYDAVICVEALEHSAHIAGALNEIFRVLKPKGFLHIIDKENRITRTVKEPWEVWFKRDDIENRLKESGFVIESYELIGDVGTSKKLFFALEANK
jgi:malonyl-CoA O-methyltransferase